jgi:hypothetical protein
MGRTCNKYEGRKGYVQNICLEIYNIKEHFEEREVDGSIIYANQS